MQERFGSEISARVDLHLHSYASGTAGNWWVRSLGVGTEARESYTPPEEVYRMAKRAGMDFVTLTDHETIDGALDLTHHPDFFVGEEISALFPEDGAHADVLVYGLDTNDHHELQARRDNIYELVEYLRETGLVHALAHPIYGMSEPVTRKQVEKRLVLFGLWEFINGSRPGGQNRLAREIATKTSAADLRLLASRHNLPTPPHQDISGTGGSDDHGGAHVGSTYTIASGVKSPKEYLEALAAGESRAVGEDGSPGKLLHTGFKIASHAIETGSRPNSSLIKSLTRNVPVLRNFVSIDEGVGGEFLSMVPLLAGLGEPAIEAALVGRYEERLSGALRGTDSGFSALNLVASLGSLVDGHLYLTPHAAVQGYFGREDKKARNLRRELFSADADTLRIGVFVDDTGENSSVATAYRKTLAGPGTANPENIRVVDCAAPGGEDRYSLRALARIPSPLAENALFGVPSFLDVLEHVVEEGYDTLHVATPGPLGISALVAGLSLGLPVVGAYHTEFGAKARELSEDEFVADIVDAAVRQFYERCSVVAVPSQSTELELRNRGYRVRASEVLEMGTNPVRTSKKLIELHTRVSGLAKDPVNVSQAGD